MVDRVSKDERLKFCSERLISYQDKHKGYIDSQLNMHTNTRGYWFKRKIERILNYGLASNFIG